MWDVGRVIYELAAERSSVPGTSRGEVVRGTSGVTASDKGDTQ